MFVENGIKPLLFANDSVRTDQNLFKHLVNNVVSRPIYVSVFTYEEVYKAYSKPMLNFFYRMLDRDRERAEDMLHDLFLKIIEKPEFFDPKKPFRAWFYTLAGNMVRNEYRRNQVNNDYGRMLSNEPEGLTDGPEKELDRQLFDQKLQMELSRFEPEHKILFNLRFVEEMTIPQIAEIMDCPEGTVKSRLFQLTRQLAKKLSIYKPL